MKKLFRLAAGAATAAVLSVTFAAPADAQYYPRYRHYDRGIDVGDVIAGVAIVGGIAAIAAAIGRDGDRYGYWNRYRYRDNYRDAVNSCAYEAERYGRGRVSITDVDRRGDGYRVRGVIDGSDRYRGYYGYGRYDRYDRYDRGVRYDSRLGFTCRTDYYGRVRDFYVNRYNW
jgi:hypothetical protein